MSDRSIRRKRRKTAVTLGAALATVPVIPAAQAATFTVSNLDDSGPGSLRQAILDANGAAGADVVEFQAGLTGAIVLSSGQIFITDSVDIQGPGAADLAVTGLGDSRLFYLYNGSALIDVTISGLTLAGGNANLGGGILDRGESLLLDSVVVIGNVASVDVEGGGDGGGLWATNTGDSMSLTILDSTFSGNTAGDDGGGIYVASAVGVNMGHIENSTISGNDAAGNGGGIAFYSVFASPDFVNSTVSGNTAGGNGGGIYVHYMYEGRVDIRHTTVSGNTAGGNGGGAFVWSRPGYVYDSIIGNNTAGINNDLGTDYIGLFRVSDSLVEDPGTADIIDDGGNIFNQDPQLGPLADNGGPTLTHLPAGTSPVINAGDPAFVPPPSTDQRGLPRVVNGRLDMGSVEVQMPAAAGTIQLTFSAANVNEGAGTVTITATRTGGSNGAVSITVNTANGTAVAPDDYGAVIGSVLSWADGDTAPKSLNITIVDDADIESSEAFDVILSNPTGGATLGTPANAIVTILDNDAAQVVEVPTVSELGMAVLTTILGMAGLYLLRRPQV
jgi:predicted outer membrane repeat protein